MSQDLPSKYAADICAAARDSRTFLGSLASAFEGRSLVPEEAQLAHLLDVAFFASMAREEGLLARFSLAIAPVGIGLGHRLEHPIPLTVATLAKLSAACHDDGTLLHVRPAGAEWIVEGVSDNAPMIRTGSTVQNAMPFLALSVRDPGSLLLRWNHEVLFVYARGLGSLRGETTLTPSKVMAVLRDLLPPTVTTMLHVGHLAAITRSMARHGRGGLLLITATDTPPPKDITFTYPVDGVALKDAAGFEERSRLYQTRPEGEAPSDATTFAQLYQSSLVDTEAQAFLVGRLTAVDGLVAMTHALRVIGFGGKVAIPDDIGDRDVVLVSPRDGGTTTSSVKNVFPGMRHRSAAAACLAQPVGTFAIALSQDGAFSVFVRDAAGLRVIRPLDRIAPW